MSLQYLKKELNCKVDVLHADKHESLLQVDSIFFEGFSQACSRGRGKFAISLWHLRKKSGMKWGTYCTGWFKYCSYNMHPMFSPHWPFYSLNLENAKSFPYLINCLCNMSSLLLFQVKVVHASWLVFVNLIIYIRFF